MFKAWFQKKERFVSPMTGKVLKLEAVPDPAFAEKMLGDGFAIELAGEYVVAPCDGKIVTAFPTGHAFGIRTKEGIEILIHIGLDTVTMKGDGFDVKVHEGDEVKQGDRLVKVDTEKIKKAGKSLISPIVFITPIQFQVCKLNQTVKINEKHVLYFTDR